jgi:hypothetical protein
MITETFYWSGPGYYAARMEGFGYNQVNSYRISEIHYVNVWEAARMLGLGTPKWYDEPPIIHGVNLVDTRK